MMKKYNITNRIAVKILCIALLSLCIGCEAMGERLRNIGKPPKFTPVTTSYNSTMLARANISNQKEDLQISKRSNTLWTPESRTFFFRDRKAKAVGDILKVKVKISDKAKLDNKVTRSRTNKSNMGIPSLFGLESKLKKISGHINPASLISTNSTETGKNSDGLVDRKETVDTTIAALVARVLPNGNLLIRGTQEVRVNFELREVTVEGIVRPEDVTRDNTVDLEQIAEARISYGGRGDITEYQQAKYGQQILDIISPF